MKWTTRDGREIEISDMSDSHLRNAIAFCRRQGFATHKEHMDILSYVCSPHTPDGALMAAEMEMDGQKLNPLFDGLIAEQEQRNDPMHRKVWPEAEPDVGDGPHGEA